MTYQDKINAARKEREQQILRLVKEGKSNVQIAQMCGCSTATVYAVRLKYKFPGTPGRPKRANTKGNSND